MTAAFVADRKPVAAIGDGSRVLLELDHLSGKTLTTVRSLESDVEASGGAWRDTAVVVDTARGWNLITSRRVDDLEAFTAAVSDVLSAESA